VCLTFAVFCFSISLPSNAEDWPKYRRDMSNTGHSAETSISSSNVTFLKERWAFRAGSAVTASPAVATVGGVSTVYVGAWNGIFYALNAVTGQKIWSFTVDMVGGCVPGSCRIGSSAFVDVKNNIVYFGAFNAFVYALRASTGALLWKRQLGDPSNGAEVWTSPAVFNGAVFVGVASHGDVPCVVGKVVALNQFTGAVNWSLSAIDQTSCPTGNCTGAGVWSSPAIDTSTGIVYIGTGNPGSTCKPSTPNATRYPDSILAINASTGKILNFVQVLHNDIHDRDIGSSPVLHSTVITNQCTGTSTPAFYVSEGGKNSNLYTVQRNSGGLVTSNVKSFTLDGSEIIGSPALTSGNVISACGTNLSIIKKYNNFFVPTGMGDLFKIAQDWNDTLSLKWENRLSTTNLFSAPAVIKDVILLGSDDHNFYAVSNTNGAVLFKFPTGSVVDSGPAISNGRIYFGSADFFVYCLSINGQ
jgi:outer membrane protein assembly factor BamB